MLYLGTPLGLEATPSWTVQGIAGGGLGGGISSAGDVNGDGYDDVILGEHLYGGVSEGRALVYHGSATGLTTTPVWTVVGSQVSEEWGSISSSTVARR